MPFIDNLPLLFVAGVAAVFAFLSYKPASLSFARGLAIAGGTILVLVILFVSVVARYEQLALVDSAEKYVFHNGRMIFIFCMSLISLGLSVMMPLKDKLDRSRLLLLISCNIAMFAVADARLLFVLWCLSIAPLTLSQQNGKIQFAPKGIAAMFYYHAFSALSLLVAGLLYYWSERQFGREASFSLVAIGDSLAAGTSLPTKMSVIFIVLAMALRQGIFPLHTGVVALFQKEKLPMVILYYLGQIGFFLPAMLGADFCENLAKFVPTVWVAVATVGAIYFGFLAFIQFEIRRVLSYVVLMVASVVPVLLYSGTFTTQAALLGQILVLLLAGSGLAMSLWLTELRCGVRYVYEYMGFASKMPLLAGFFVVFGLCLINFPITLGFFSEDFILHEVMTNLPFLTVFLLIAFAVGGLAAYRLYARIFLGTTAVEMTFRDLMRREAVILGTLLLLFLLISLAPLGSLNLFLPSGIGA